MKTLKHLRKLADALTPYDRDRSEIAPARSPGSDHRERRRVRTDARAGDVEKSLATHTGARGKGRRRVPKIFNMFSIPKDTNVG